MKCPDCKEYHTPGCTLIYQDEPLLQKCVFCYYKIDEWECNTTVVTRKEDRIEAERIRKMFKEKKCQTEKIKRSK